MFLIWPFQDNNSDNAAYKDELAALIKDTDRIVIIFFYISIFLKHAIKFIKM